MRLRKKFSNVLLWLGFPKLLRLIPLSPDWANINVTENCNSRCVTCNAWKNKFADELTTEEIKDALHQLKDIGVRNVILIGGEPLLRKDIGCLVKEANLLQFRTIMVVTNGLLLEDKAEELLESGVTHLTVSIDGVGHTNEVVRGVPGNYEKSIRGIQTVQRIKKDRGLNTAVTILTTILLNQNADEIPKLVEISRSLGAYWTCNLLDPNLPIFRGIPYFKLLIKNHKKIDETIDYLKQTRRNSPRLVSSCDHVLDYARYYLKTHDFFPPFFHCVHGYTLVWIGSRGDIHSGCWIMEPLGNLRENKLRDILRSDRYRKCVERMYRNECPGCTNLHAFNIAMNHLVLHKLQCETNYRKAVHI